MRSNNKTNKIEIDSEIEIATEPDVDNRSENNFKSNFRKLGNLNNTEYEGNFNYNNPLLTINSAFDSKSKKSYVNNNLYCNYLNCKNLPKLQELKKYIIELTDEIKALSFINKSLINKVAIKENYISNLLKVNNTNYSSNKRSNLSEKNQVLTTHSSYNYTNNSHQRKLNYDMDSLKAHNETINLNNNNQTNINFQNQTTKNSNKKKINFNVDSNKKESETFKKIPEENEFNKLPNLESRKSNKQLNKIEINCNFNKQYTHDSQKSRNSIIIENKRGSKTFSKTGFIYKLVSKILPEIKNDNHNDSPVKYSSAKKSKKSEDEEKEKEKKHILQNSNSYKDPEIIKDKFQEKSTIKMNSLNNQKLSMRNRDPIFAHKNTNEEKEKERIQKLKISNELSSKYLNNQNSHYNKINNLFKRIEKSCRATNSRISFLAINDNILNRMLKSDLITEILKLTDNDEEFVVSMRTFADDKLHMVSDLFSTLIKDYQYSLQLIRRIKTFMDISVKLVHSKNANESIGKILTNCIEVLSCEASKIFIYDKNCNLLVNHCSSNQSHGELKTKISTDEGIIGHVYTNNQRQKIDDASSDNRFSSVLKKSKIDLSIKTVICTPLRDESGNSIGVLESLNKKGGFFTSDDEELMDIFAKQIASTFTSNIEFDEFHSHIFHLQNLLEFSLVIPYKENLKDFVVTCENSLKSIWNISHARLYFIDTDCNYDKENVTCIVNEEIKTFKSVGLVGKCLQKREVIPVQNIHESRDYNSLIDIEGSLCLVTFPILDNSSMVDIIMVMQMEFNSNYLHLGKLKKNHLDVVMAFSNQLAFWYSRNKINLNKNELIIQRGMKDSVIMESDKE